MRAVMLDDARPSSLDLYATEIGRTPLLTAAEEVVLAGAVRDGLEAEQRLAQPRDPGERDDLLRRQRRGREARERMVRANLRLVISIAKKHQNRGLPMEDLVQEGTLG